jgi:glycosyltransferase involved in cell wall biosynthesis
VREKTAKIAVLAADAAGGAERTTVGLANGLSQRGYGVDLLLLDARGPFLDDILPDVHVVDFATRHVRSSVLRLVRYLRAEKPEVLFSNLDHLNVGALLARRLARAATRVVPIVHIALSQAIAGSKGFRAALLPRAIRWFYPSADAIVVVSQAAADDLVQTCNVPQRLVRVIYEILTPGVRERAAAPLDEPWFAPGQPDVILSAGRLTQQKDFPTLIRAFALLRRERRCRLLILGEGEDRRALEELVRELGLEDDVALPGYARNVFAYMARCALFVLSSAWEGMPLVLMEALAAGARVVATDCRGGSSEMLRGGKYGRLVPVGDAGILAAAMGEALCEPRHPLPEEALRRFALDTIVDQYAALIEELRRKEGGVNANVSALLTPRAR